MPGRHPNELVKIGSNPDDRTIELHPDHYRPLTAGGEALRAHELFHVQQRLTIPNFEEEFQVEAERVAREGLMPWQNRFEAPAYEFEQRVKADLLSQGLPARFSQELRAA